MLQSQLSLPPLLGLLQLLLLERLGLERAALMFVLLGQVLLLALLHGCELVEVELSLGLLLFLQAGAFVGELLLEACLDDVLLLFARLLLSANLLLVELPLVVDNLHPLVVYICCLSGLLKDQRGALLG